MEAIRKKLILWFMQTSFYFWLMRKVIWRIRFTTYYTDFSGIKYKAGLKHLKKGSIVLTQDRLKLTGLLIPGIVDHACLCVNDKHKIVEMTHLGFGECDFFDTCKESTRVIIMRCKRWDKYYINKICKYVFKFKDCDYDLDFTFGIKKLYCSELIYQADFKHKMRVDLSDFAGIGREYISPTGLLFSMDNYCVFDSDGVFQGMTGKEIEEKVNNVA